MPGNRIKCLRLAVFSIVCLALLFVSCYSTAPQKRAGDFNQYGIKCLKGGLWGEAEFRFRQALELNQEMASYHNNLAVALEAQGRIDEALKEYEAGLKLDPANKEIYDNLTRFKNVNNLQ
jgi:Flp pilus assembly protein TadD